MIDEVNSELLALGRQELTGEIIRLRQAIRLHRDQVGDDRCWLDDVLLYSEMPDTSLNMERLPDMDAFMFKCERFADHRQCPADKSPTAVRYSNFKAPGCEPDKSIKNLDDTLAKLSDHELRIELSHLQAAIRAHRSRFDQGLTWKEDSEIYAVLPEKLDANTKLPERKDFLSNCRNYWNTRQSQSPQKLHEW